MTASYQMTSGDHVVLLIVARDQNDALVDLASATDAIWAVGETIFGPRKVKKSLGQGVTIPAGTPRNTIRVEIETGELTVAQDRRLRHQAWAVFAGDRQCVFDGELVVRASVDVEAAA